MEISVETASYNERRYGKPWIAKVDFAVNRQGEFQFGEWVGSPGGAGVLELDVEPGDIVARGQKDHRNSKNSAAEYYMLNSSGELEYLGDKGAAYKHFRVHKK